MSKRNLLKERKDISPESNLDLDSEVCDVLNRILQHVEHEKSDLPSDENPSTNNPVCKPEINVSNTKCSVEILPDRSKHRSGSRKARIRNRKRKWKPYCKLTWDERKKLEERDSRRAQRFREKMSASGLTLAPYNTTQFLMEDHNLQEPDYESIHHYNKSKEDCHSNDSEDYYSSPDEDFIQREFSETYDSLHDDYIGNMTKFELVRELMRLEDAIESVEESLRDSIDKKRLQVENSQLDVEAELEKIQVFQDEIEKLAEENRLLKAENEMLETRITELLTM